MSTSLISKVKWDQRFTGQKCGQCQSNSLHLGDPQIHPETLANERKRHENKGCFRPAHSGEPERGTRFLAPAEVAAMNFGSDTRILEAATPEAEPLVTLVSTFTGSRTRLAKQGSSASLSLRLPGDSVEGEVSIAQSSSIIPGG